MKFITRAFGGLFIAALSLAFIVAAAILVREAIKDRMSQEPRFRPNREQSFVVNTVTFAPQTIAPQLTTYGRVQSNQMLELRIKRGGQIIYAAPEYTEGGVVKAGTLLLQTDESDERVALGRAEVEYRAALADVTDAENTLGFAKRDLAVAKEQLELQLQALARTRELSKNGVLSTTELENGELSFTSVRQSALGKERALGQAETALENAKTRVELAALSRQEAEHALEDTQLIAEFDGVLSGVNAVVGGLANTNEQVGSLFNPADLDIELRVSNAQFSRLLDGNGGLIRAQVIISLQLQDVAFETTGTITRASAVVEDGLTGRLIFAKVDPEGALHLRSGDFVTITIQEPDLENVARIPSSALDGEQMVLVLGDENRLEAVQVELLRRQDNDVLVRAPDLAGRQLVAERTPLLGEGILVTPFERAEDGTVIGAPQQRGGKPIGGSGNAGAGGGATVAITDAQRLELIEKINNTPNLPDRAKRRMLETLEQPEVPVDLIERLQATTDGRERDEG